MKHDKIVKDIVERGVVNVIPSTDKLTKLLNSDKLLNVYLGIDPTATKIHLGHAVPLRKLGKFVELGHNVTFVIGDFTALIGDSSDKDSERPILTKEQIEVNFRTYKSQVEKVIDFSKIKVVHNRDWLSELTFEDVVKITQNYSVGDFVSRELIKKRLRDGKRVRLDETLYPVMQGYDSYYLDTDIQLGAADQTFNMQAGRTLQKNLRGKESFVLVNDYLIGTDGHKMSKSIGNAIWIDDNPYEMFGKLMAINDNVIENYLTLATNLELLEVQDLIESSKKEPMKAKMKLAYQVVSEIYDAKSASEAQDEWTESFQKGMPTYDEELDVKHNLLEFVTQKTGSKSESKRLIFDGAINVNEVVVKDPKAKVAKGDRVKIGKRIFVTAR